MERDLGITFAGGGSRAFYQLGWLERYSEALLPRVAAISGCSAGSAMAAVWLSGRTEETRVFFAQRRQGVKNHMDMRRLLRGQSPFPHDGIYRATIRHALADGGLERIKAQPFPVNVLCAGFPTALPSGVSIALGLAAYQLEKKVRPKMLHPTFPRYVGFKQHAWDMRDCETAEEAVELVISSSATPPFTKRGRFEKRLLLDGSMIDNAPAFLTEASPEVRRNLVLLTRPYPNSTLGQRDTRLYIAPEEPLPITRWDYRETAPVDETLSAGRRDADRDEELVAAFLN